MKNLRTICILFLLFVAVTVSHAVDISLSTGQVLRNATIDKFFAGEFVIEHNGGIARVPWAQMPASYQAQHPFDQEAVVRERQIAVLNAAKANRVRLGVRTIKEVASDITAFDGRDVSFEGTIEISDYYNYGFREAKESCFSFEVRDQTARMHVYFPKAQAAPLRAELLRAGKALQGIVTVRISRSLSSPSGLLARGMEFYPPSLPSEDGSALVARSRQY